MKVLVASLSANSRLGRLLRARGVEVEEIQVGEIVAVASALPDDVRWVAIASQNSIPSLVDAFAALDHSRSAPKIAAVGEKTAAALRQAGFAVDFVPKKASGESLRREFAACCPGERLFDFKGYENRPLPIGGTIDLSRFAAAYFTCASSVERVFAVAVGQTLCCSIGDATSAALRKHCVRRILQAAESTIESLAAIAVNG